MSDGSPVLVSGSWRASTGSQRFHSVNPSTLEELRPAYPISDWSEVEQVLDAAVDAFQQLRHVPESAVAEFLDSYAKLIDENNIELAELAHAETALAVKPRLSDVELPRTSNQLRQASEAVRTGSWRQSTIDSKNNIRSCFQAFGPVAVFGPNNFPFAFGSVSGGDFASAIAAGNPVIGKANSSHPKTTQRLAELALDALESSGLPLATVQLIYRLDHSDGLRLASDHRLAAIGYTGSRKAGLALKKAADSAGIPIYLELSSVNPVVILPGALRERRSEIVNEFVASVLLGTGQFCTNPGLLFLVHTPESDAFINTVASQFTGLPAGTLLSRSVQDSLSSSIRILTASGAELLCGGIPIEGRCSVANTLLKVSGEKFLADPIVFQTEAFGNASLVVQAKSVDAIGECIDALEGNLTGCIYSAFSGEDDVNVQVLSDRLVQRVGRLLNDKMPTGVAVSPAMNHGGPYPATGHPGFTAVGIPASILRFCKLTCYDSVRHERLPRVLQNKNPTGKTWRMIDQEWTTADVPTTEPKGSSE